MFNSLTHSKTEQVCSRARHQSEENKNESTPVNMLEYPKENTFVCKEISYAVVTNEWLSTDPFLVRELFKERVVFPM